MCGYLSAFTTRHLAQHAFRYDGNTLLDQQDYFSELIAALNRLDTFDSHVPAEINNGKIIEPEATELLDASAVIRLIINNLIINI